ncbi:MAG: hypothetical protein ACRCUE_02590, partial [Bosea sp. (in: a-proteobacteria)]
MMPTAPEVASGIMPLKAFRFCLRQNSRKVSSRLGHACDAYPAPKSESRKHRKFDVCECSFLCAGSRVQRAAEAVKLQSEPQGCDAEEGEEA